MSKQEKPGRFARFFDKLTGKQNKTENKKDEKKYQFDKDEEIKKRESSSSKKYDTLTKSDYDKFFPDKKQIKYDTFGSSRNLNMSDDKSQKNTKVPSLLIDALMNKADKNVVTPKTSNNKLEKQLTTDSKSDEKSISSALKFDDNLSKKIDSIQINASKIKINY
jgi:hypothetical protein